MTQTSDIRGKIQRLSEELFKREADSILAITLVEHCLGSPEILKAQQLYTREEVKEYILAAISITGRNPGIEKDAEKLAEQLLSPPPKTDNV